MSVPAIVGTGWAVPKHVRGNDDPIFDWLKKNFPHGTDLFTGYRERRVLTRGEDLDTILLPAARDAIARAEIAPREIDLVLGTASVSPFQSPDLIASLPEKLGLSPRAWTLPLHDDFSNYNAGVVIADSLIRVGRAKHALIVCAGNWTQYVDYHTPQSVSASDGAGAAVVSSHRKGRAFEVVDSETFTDASYFGSMFMRGEEVHVQGLHEPLYTRATFHITEKGQEGFKTFGLNEPPRLAKRILDRNGLKGAEVALVTHQASAVLMDAWQKAIEPGQYLRTLEEFANMTVANIAVDVAYFYERIEREHLLLLAIGTEMHANAVLLSRR